MFAPRVLTLAALVAGCGARPKEGVAPGVLVVAIDGLRADHLSVYGYDRETCPNLAALAGEGARFEEVFASAPLLLPAHVALMTGCEPSQARRYLSPEFEGISERRWFIPERLPRAAVAFLSAGYATAAFVEDERLSDAFGFDRGFQEFRVLVPESAQDWEGPQSTRVVEHFLRWLATLSPSQPWFAYLELHALERVWTQPLAEKESFFPPRPEQDVIPPVANTDSVLFAIPRSRWRGRVRTLGEYEATYDDEIRHLDTELGRLFATLRRLGRDDASTIHVLGAFGVQFGEAGLYLSAGRYSLADLRVPWIVRPRAGSAAPRGASVPGLVSSLDLVPTALELEGLAVPPGVHGRSQAARVRGERGAGERPFVYASCGLQEGCAVIGARHVLEYLAPLTTNDAQLRRSWSGLWTEPARQPKLFFYDRRATPFPPLDEGGSLERDADFTPLRTAAIDWLLDMNDLRQILQSPEQAGDTAVIERLARNGYPLPAR
jgi:arylsulfatase A-like enzyme